MLMNLLEIAKAFITGGRSGAINMDEVWKQLEPVARIMMAVAIAVYIGVGMVIGVKFMYKGPDEKAKMKERLIWYILAGVLIFGVVGIFNIIVNTLTGITET